MHPTETRSNLPFMVVAGVAAIVGLAIIVWVAGLLAHAFGVLVQVAAAAAVAAWVWHRVSRHLARRDQENS